MQHLFTIDGDPAEAWLASTANGYRLLQDGHHHDVALTPETLTVDGVGTRIVLVTQGDTVWVHVDGAAYEIVLHDPVHHYAVDAAGGVEDVVRAPMPGAVIAVHVADGAQVKAGEALMVIESMKLETVIKAPRDGVVEAVGFAAGQSFDRDAALVTLAKEG